MAILIDATLLIDRERGRPGLEERIARRKDEPFFLSVITVSELLHGVHRATEPVRKARRSAFVETVIDRFPLLGIDLPTSRTHAEVWAQLAKGGQLIGAHDMWLAAAALAHDLTLATANVREFARVPGLVIEDWSD